MAPSLSLSPRLEARRLTVGVAGKVFCRDLDFALAAGERLSINWIAATRDPRALTRPMTSASTATRR